jgi:D-sedoheptulose 7-phosphate isomerase
MTTGMLPVAILAGGLATRMRPLTEKIPKALIELHHEPFIAHQLRLLRSHGIQRVCLCVGYLGEMIEQLVGDGSAFGLQVTYSHDGPTLLGTAGALRQALPQLGDAFFVLYGDSYLPCDYAAAQAAFESSERPSLMTVFRNEGRWDRSNVVFADGRIHVYDKFRQVPEMKYIDYGLGILRAGVLNSLPPDEPRDLALLYHELAAAGQLAGFEVSQRFYEIGSTEGLEETRQYLGTQPNIGSNSMDFIQQYLAEVREIVDRIDVTAINKMVERIAATREAGGRLFLLGVGGSAANASHAVNDFRKIVGIESYAPTDNVSELTARTNDEGWATVFVEWLRTSHLTAKDLIFVLSVGGGNLDQQVSPNLVCALQYAKEVGAGVIGIVGRDGGYTAAVADACVIVPTVNPAHITPHSEAFQAVVWHLLVSDPRLKAAQTKWESMK